ncbi:MAG: hypothetical protein Q9184_001369 [Pyrenodesmia sp. 2 TL-2023]
MIHLAFLLHILVELPASIAFFFKPSMTLPRPQPHAHAVIRQYSLLLLSTNLIAYAFLFRPADETSATIAAALAVYHLGPLVRAGSRIGRGEARRVKGVGSPWVHLVVHAACLVLLIWEAGQGF